MLDGEFTLGGESGSVSGQITGEGPDDSDTDPSLGVEKPAWGCHCGNWGKAEAYPDHPGGPACTCGGDIYAGLELIEIRPDGTANTPSWHTANFLLFPCSYVKDDNGQPYVEQTRADGSSTCGPSVDQARSTPSAEGLIGKAHIVCGTFHSPRHTVRFQGLSNDHRDSEGDSLCLWTRSDREAGIETSYALPCTAGSASYICNQPPPPSDHYVYLRYRLPCHAATKLYRGLILQGCVHKYKSWCGFQYPDGCR